MGKSDFSAGEARRIALSAQGFDRPRPDGVVDVRHVRRTIRQLGLVQLDYVNVLIPAHYQVLYSRLGQYDRDLLDDVVYRRREFTEQWAHEASIVPMETWPLLRHRRDSHRVRPWGFEKELEEHSDYVDWVLNEVRSRGPLTANDLPEADGMAKRVSDKWGWGLNLKKQVLEAHFGRGSLAVANRQSNFVRSYDVTERIVPEGCRERRLGRDEEQRALLALAARSHGIATAADLADYYRMLVRDARPRIAELVESGDLMEVAVEGWNETAYLHRNVRLPRIIRAASLLSPFDPLIWFRPRVKRLFDFEYRIEIFVPEPKRRWGYYVLPFLLDDRLVARADLKADRKGGRLIVRAVHVEPACDRDSVANALADELRSMSQWLKLGPVAVGRRGNFARHLSKSIRSS